MVTLDRHQVSEILSTVQAYAECVAAWQHNAYQAQHAATGTIRGVNAARKTRRLAEAKILYEKIEAGLSND